MDLPVERNEEVESILAKCAKSLKYHAVFFHGHRFTRPFSRSHERFFEVADDKTVQQICIVAHRGWGKTSLINLAVPSQYLLFYDNSALSGFYVPIGGTSTLAVLQSENLKRALDRNSIAKAACGSIRSETTFSKEEWVTSNDVYVLPRGPGQQIRGLLYNDARPQLITCDDLEKKGEVRNPELRKELESWFLSDVSNCVDRALNNWRMYYIGTLLHEDALLSNIMDDPKWVTLNFPLCDESYKSYWPMFMSDTECKDLGESLRNKHKYDEFCMEYLNILTPADDAVFTQDKFRYFVEGSEETLVKNSDGSLILTVDFNDPYMDHIVLVDPARTEKVHNDYTAIVGVTIDTAHNRIFVRDIINEHLRPTDIYKKMVEMADRIHAKTIGFEFTGLNEFARQPIMDYLSSLGKVYEIIELNPRGGEKEGAYAIKGKSKGKVARVKQLAPYYSMGWIYHNPNCCSALESQLLSYPFSKHWDIMDALAYVLQMMEEGDRYFSESYDTVALGNEEEDLERELRLLEGEDEEPISEAAFALGF